MTQTNGSDNPQVVAGINRAIALAANGEMASAVEHLLVLLVDFHSVASIHGYLGWFLSQIERYDEAIIESRKATVLSPRSQTASLIYFHVLWKTGKHVEATDEIKRFLAIQPCEEYMEIMQEIEREKKEEKNGISQINDCE